MALNRKGSETMWHGARPEKLTMLTKEAIVCNQTGRHLERRKKRVSRRQRLGTGGMIHVPLLVKYNPAALDKKEEELEPRDAWGVRRKREHHEQS